MQPLISIVIPVYNVESYLPQCLDSVLRDNAVEGMQVVCIDDGSTDGSAIVLSDYMRHYPTLQVLTQTNAGLSCARNAGLEVATGKYVYFMDSDDYLYPDVLRKMVSFMERNNLQVGCFNVLKDGKDPYYPNTTRIDTPCTGEEFAVQFRQQCHYSYVAPVWMYLYRRAFLQEQHLVFKPSVLHEDEEFTPRVLFAAERIALLNISVQHHRVQRKGAITAQTTKKHLMDSVDSIRGLMQTYAHLPNKEQIKHGVFDFWLLTLCKAYQQGYSLSDIGYTQKDAAMLMQFNIWGGVRAANGSSFEVPSVIADTLLPQPLSALYPAVAQQIFDFVAAKPFVAIDCLVYNHEPYLRECLEGFVMQQTDFPFVAVVHDDASTDKSADIIREYAEKYPNIIHPIYETENQYRKPNRALGHVMDSAIDATGAKYVAMCEGDDYWTDPKKLQKQVAFMEEHHEYSLCCHRYRIYNEDTKTWEEDYEAEHFADGANADGFAFTKADNLRCWIAKTNTLMYRREALCNDLLNQYRYSRDVHRVYHLLKRGNGYCLPWDGAVYRRQQGGVFSSLSSAQKQRTSFLIYAELLQRNTDDTELATYFGELYAAYRDNLRCAVQHRQAHAGELTEFLRYAYRFYGLHGVAYAVRKFCLSWRKALRERTPAAY